MFLHLYRYCMSTQIWFFETQTKPTTLDEIIYHSKCVKSGLNKSKKEGDFSTPRGRFKLGMLYYRKDRTNNPITKLKKIEIKALKKETITFLNWIKVFY